MTKKTSSLTNPVARQIADRFKASMPSNDEVIGAALNVVIGAYHGDVEAIKNNASSIIRDAEAVAYRFYLEAEGPAATEAIERTFIPMLSAEASGEDGVRLVAGNAAALNQFYLSVSQSRKSRAGSALETFFDTLFRALRYKFEREHVVNGTPDFVFPSAAHFRRLPTDCIVFTSKRTLRERWRQITTEGSRGFLLFLGTLDSTIKPNDLEQMKDQKIYMVVPEEIRAARYASQPHVLSVERFLADYLDPAMDRWRRNGVIAGDGDLLGV